MNHIRRSKTILSGRIAALSPVFAAVALGWSALQAHAALSVSDAQAALVSELNTFAAEETTGTPKVYNFTVGPNTVVTAPANDLVYAIYRIIGKSTGVIVTSPDDISTLVQVALGPVNGKNRADINTVAPRVFNAAIVGGDLNGIGAGLEADPAAIQQILTAVATSNSKITAAGKEALVAQALKVADPTTTAGGDIATEALVLANPTTGAATDAMKQAFALAALKKVGTSTSQVSSFAQTFLTGITSTVRDTTAVNLAVGLATTPVVAGAVIGGRAAEIAQENDAATSRTDINALLTTVINKAALAADVTDSVGQALISYSSSASMRLSEAQSLLTSLPTAKQTPTERAELVGAYLQSLGGSAMAQDVTDALTTLAPTLTAAQLAAFAGTAARGTVSVPVPPTTTVVGDIAGQLAAKVAAGTQPAEATAITAIGTAVVKAVAVADPASLTGVASSLITTGNADSTQAFGTDALKETLAVNLVKAAPTNGVAAAALVEGVLGQLTTQTAASLNTLGAKTIIAAPSTAINVAETLTLAAGTTAFGSVSASTFAAGLVTDSADHFPVSAAGSVAAGASLTNPTNAGAITTAVIQANTTLAAQAVGIATKVAGALDIENIAAMGEAVAKILPTTVDGSKLPTFASAVGPLATALGKAINAKATEQTSNRTDELGELAASLTTVAISKGAVESTIASIGTSIFKALSATYQQNGGPFPADLKDAAQYIAGAIAQTISVDSTLTLAQKQALLSLTGPLEKALAAAAATAFPKTTNGVTAAFNDVNTAGIGNLVPGTMKLDSSGDTGKYEIGNFVDPETKITNS